MTICIGVKSGFVCTGWIGTICKTHYLVVHIHRCRHISISIGYNLRIIRIPNIICSSAHYYIQRFFLYSCFSGNIRQKPLMPVRTSPGLVSPKCLPCKIISVKCFSICIISPGCVNFFHWTSVFPTMLFKFLKNCTYSVCCKIHLAASKYIRFLIKKEKQLKFCSSLFSSLTPLSLWKLFLPPDTSAWSEKSGR